MCNSRVLVEKNLQFEEPYFLLRKTRIPVPFKRHMEHLERKLDEQIEAYNTMDKVHKNLITPRMRKTILVISFLCTLYMMFSSLEIGPVCTDWEDAKYLVDKMPFSSNTETISGNIMVDFLVWMYTLIYTIVFRTMFIWPLFVFLFFLISKRINVSWRTQPWVEEYRSSSSPSSPDIATVAPIHTRYPD